MKLLFLDTETTGADVAKDRLCQVAYKADDEIVSGLFKPPLPISVKSMSITHITNKMVQDKEPFEGSNMYAHLQELLKDRTLVAHNAAFDSAILENEGLSVPSFICTLKVARALDVEGIIPEHNLQYLRYYLDLDVPGANAHDAKDDVLVLKALFDRLYSKMMEQHNNEDKVYEEMKDISLKPSLIRTFRFGKYNGMKMEEVAQTDPGYLEWLLGQKQAAQASGDGTSYDEDIIYSLNKALGRS